MTNCTGIYRPREAADQESFIEAVQTVLDYLWDDEQQYHAEYGDDGQEHIFNSLQLIREKMDRMRREADENPFTSPPDSIAPKSHED